MGLWDVIDEQKNKIRVIAINSINTSIAPAVRKAVSKGEKNVAISLGGGEVLGLSGAIDDLEVIEVFKEICRQLCLEGFNLGLIFSCDRQHNFLRYWNPIVAGKLVDSPVLRWECHRCQGINFGFLKAFTIEWSEKSKEKAGSEGTVATQDGKVEDRYEKSLVQNITYNIHDSSIVGDLNSNPVKKNNE